MEAQIKKLQQAFNDLNYQFQQLTQKEKVKVKKPSLLNRILGFFIDKAIDRYFHGIWIRKIKGEKKIVMIYY